MSVTVYAGAGIQFLVVVVGGLASIILNSWLPSGTNVGSRFEVRGQFDRTYSVLRPRFTNLPESILEDFSEFYTSLNLNFWQIRGKMSAIFAQTWKNRENFRSGSKRASGTISIMPVDRLQLDHGTHWVRTYSDTGSQQPRVNIVQTARYLWRQLSLDLEFTETFIVNSGIRYWRVYTKVERNFSRILNRNHSR